MINSISIKNFETHKNTHIDFHPGVSVIVGESDEGKSGIVRSIKWNAKNRPQGDEYRNDQLDSKKKEDKLKVTEVGIVYENSGLVIRARDGFAGGVNHYQINNGEPLRALRTDVPDEVQEITRMKEINIQGQHPTEQYFLLADKPGQVAKEFNKVAGLTIMDKALSEINSQIRTCNTKIKIVSNEIKNGKKEIKNTSWIDKAEKLSNKLLKYKSKIEKEQVVYDSLKEKIYNMDQIEEIFARYYDGLDDAIKELSVLEKEKIDIDQKNNELISLSNLIFDIKSTDLKLNEYKDIDEAIKALKSIKIEKDEIEKLDYKIKEMSILIYKLEKNIKEETKATIELINAEQEYVKIFKYQKCPTCGRKGI